MKILIVSQYFWPENFRINDLSTGLQEKGHEVTVLTGLPNYPGGKLFKGYSFVSPLEENFHGVRIIRVPLIPRGSGRSIRLALNYISFALVSSLLAPIRCRDKFDIVFIFEPSPITVCFPAVMIKHLRKIPLFLWVQDLWPESLSATGAITSKSVLDKVERMVSFLYSKIDCILVSSQAYIPSVMKLSPPGHRIEYFPQFVESLYQPVKLPVEAHERSHLPSGFIVMFAGNIGVAQDFDTILSAAERIRHYGDIHWVIVGDGRNKGWVEEEIESRQLKATFHLLGQFPLDTMPHYFSLADVMLVTLKDDPIFALTVPGKIQSYLACAKPVISVLNGEGGRIIEESRSGYACKAGDAEGLADAVLRMYALAPDERLNMGLAGRAYFEIHFEREMLLDRLEAWMQNAVNRTGAIP